MLMIRPHGKSIDPRGPLGLIQIDRGEDKPDRLAVIDGDLSCLNHTRCLAQIKIDETRIDGQISAARGIPDFDEVRAVT